MLYLFCLCVMFFFFPLSLEHLESGFNWLHSSTQICIYFVFFGKRLSSMWGFGSVNDSVVNERSSKPDASWSADGDRNFLVINQGLKAIYWIILNLNSQRFHLGQDCGHDMRGSVSQNISQQIS